MEASASVSEHDSYKMQFQHCNSFSPSQEMLASQHSTHYQGSSSNSFQLRTLKYFLCGEHAYTNYFCLNCLIMITRGRETALLSKLVTTVNWHYSLWHWTRGWRGWLGRHQSGICPPTTNYSTTVTQCVFSSHPSWSLTTASGEALNGMLGDWLAGQVTTDNCLSVWCGADTVRHSRTVVCGSPVSGARVPWSQSLRSELPTSLPLSQSVSTIHHLWADHGVQHVPVINSRIFVLRIIIVFAHHSAPLTSMTPALLTLATVWSLSSNQYRELLIAFTHATMTQVFKTEHRTFLASSKLMDGFRLI